MTCPRSRYQKCRALGNRGATTGERTAAWAAAHRIWSRHTSIRIPNPLAAAQTGQDIRDALDRCWAHDIRGGGWTVDSVELSWYLECCDLKALQEAHRLVTADLRAGHTNGVYTGTISLKKLNLNGWLLEKAIAQFQ